MGKDRFYKSWNGYIGNLKLNLCSGASEPSKDFINLPPNLNSFPKFYVTETIETCLIDTKIIEITQVNLKSVINILQAQGTQERICYCSPSKIEQLKV
ncbi:unnamed protein product [Paramecium sonneborni]|nr:unnamed protein product [Paramecium sonneborni]